MNCLFCGERSHCHNYVTYIMYMCLYCTAGIVRLASHYIIQCSIREKVTSCVFLTSCLPLCHSHIVLPVTATSDKVAMMIKNLKDTEPERFQTAMTTVPRDSALWALFPSGLWCRDTVPLVGRSVDPRLYAILQSTKSSLLNISTYSII